MVLDVFWELDVRGREGLGLSGVLDVGESSRRSGSGGLGAFGVHWVRRIGCGAHRSWRIRRPAAARQSVLSELEPRARTKHPASLLIGLLLIVCCLDVDGLLGGGWYAGGLGEGNKKPGPGGLGCMV